MPLPSSHYAPPVSYTCASNNLTVNFTNIITVPVCIVGIVMGLSIGNVPDDVTSRDPLTS